VADGAGIAVSAIGFGFVYGLSAREAGFSVVEAMAMSTIVFAGAAQFAAVGYVASGLPWIGVVLLTALLNARHLLYSAALAPWLRDVPTGRRAAMAHVLTDEAFALAISHFRRLGRADERGYWFGAVVMTFIPWNLATLAGVVLGAQITDPARLGIDVIFPAAMIGLAVGLITGRRELVAAIVGAGVAVVVALASSPAYGIVAGGVIGPAVGLLVPAAIAAETAPLGSPASAARYSMPGAPDDPDRALPTDGDGPP
jgi:4-azaleucine resistance transporter AzlC